MRVAQLKEMPHQRFEVALNGPLFAPAQVVDFLRHVLPIHLVRPVLTQRRHLVLDLCEIVVVVELRRSGFDQGHRR
jgi:hypothetical protein